MKTSGTTSPDGPGIERFEALALRLRDAARSATIQPWGVSDSYFHLPGYVVGRPATVGLTVLIARAKANRAEQAIALFRSTGPGFVASVEGLLDLASAPNGTPISADTVERVMVGAWGDRLSPWFWKGWDPGARLERDHAGDAPGRDSWISPTAQGPVARGSRTIDIPRTSLYSTAPGAWTCAKEGPHAQLARLVADSDGVEVARFAREQDAIFTVIAREAVSVFGAAVAAVGALVDANADRTIDPAVLLDTIAHSTPWPFEAPTETSTEEGLSTR